MMKWLKKLKRKEWSETYPRKIDGQWYWTVERTVLTKEIVARSEKPISKWSAYKYFLLGK